MEVANPLLRLVYEVDPILCPNCHSEMKIIAVIKDGKVIDKMLAHLQTSLIRYFLLRYDLHRIPLCLVAALLLSISALIPTFGGGCWHLDVDISSVSAHFRAIRTLAQKANALSITPDPAQ